MPQIHVKSDGKLLIIIETGANFERSINAVMGILTL